jgi:type VI secretion system protein VasD
MSALATLSSLTGCASAPSAPAMPSVAAAGQADAGGVTGFFSGLADSALGAVGLKKPDVPQAPAVPDSALPDYKVAWRVYASDSLNVDTEGHALALVVRMFKLKSPDAFLQLPYDTFGDPAREKAALGDDLVAARELQLVPGQHYEATDKVAREARYIGIVALYREPMPGRWRYAFSTPDADQSGLHIGAHACAMSVQVGQAIGLAGNAARSVAAPCP